MRHFRANCSGTVTMEAAILVPLILAPVFFGTFDMGMAINSGQNLTSTTRAGTQYLLNGGRDAADLKSVIIDSFDGTLEQSDITISTSCACPNADAIPADGSQSTTLPFSYRATALNTLEQCSITCGDGSRERVLVNLSIDYTTNGLYRDVVLNKTISVRIK